MILTVREYLQLQEATPAADTLHDAQKTKPTATAEVEALAAFQKLKPEHQKRTLDYLQKSLDGDSNDAWAHAGIPFGTAEKNRASHRPGGGTTSAGDLKIKKLKKEEIAESMKAQASSNAIRSRFNFGVVDDRSCDETVPRLNVTASSMVMPGLIFPLSISVNNFCFGRIWVNSQSALGDGGKCV
jgi:hypothetical protein